MYKDKIAQARENFQKNSVYRNNKEVKRMLEIAQEVYKSDLDMMSGEQLMKLGGELAGLYVYFGNLYAEARSEHEISENAYNQVLEAVKLSYIESDSGYKVTEAKAAACRDLETESSDMVLKEAIYKEWSTVIETCKTLIMFIQSCISQKKSEAFLRSNPV